ncbi:MAG: GDP-fucose synthetase [Clostridiales bacterium]|nr:GDP-fucose synthetase [Clostridiales bacterium]
MDDYSKIYIAGHNGLVGSAIFRNLKGRGFHNLIVKSHKELDLEDQLAVREFFTKERPEYVFLAAAKVGGIQANNTIPADFIYNNLMIQNNVIKACHDFNVKKLLFLGSTCIYPKLCPQPIKEEYLLSGYLEKTNEAYAIAKIAGLEMCKFFKRQYGDNFISCMPTNLYGSNDNFDLHNSHVLPALLRKFHEAKQNHDMDVEVWGTGNPLREFMYVDDMADACVFLMDKYDDEGQVNIGTGEEITIRELAYLIKRIVGYNGNIIFNSSLPDGTLRKLTDVSKLHSLGWKHKISIEEGIILTYDWYVNTYL